MTLLYPIGLLAFAGLIIPVLIHLWSVKKGKVLKIGSIALLGENATASSKSIRITDIILFILRCLIIIFIAFVLAEPYLKQTTVNQKNAGWILVDKTQFDKAYQANRNKIDSLLKLGFELRDFNLGFNKFTLEDTAANTIANEKLTYTSLLNQLNTEIPIGYSAHIFANRKVVNFEGTLPKPKFKLFWNDLQTNDTLKNWATTFLAKTYEGKSTPSSTSYTSGLSQDLPVINAVIYGDSDDSRYIKAALNAIEDFTRRKIEVNNWNSLSSSKADLLFWLSEKPLLLPNHRNGANLFTYQKGKNITLNSTLQVSLNPSQRVGLYKRIASDGLKGTTIWNDGFGDPILVKEEKEALNHFHFYSRFNPQWTDLVWDEQFVQALIPIVLDTSNNADFGFESHDADQRVIAKQQLPGSNYKEAGIFNISSTQDITKWVWAIAFIFLIIERILSLRKKAKSSYVKS